MGEHNTCRNKYFSQVLHPNLGLSYCQEVHVQSLLFLSHCSRRRVVWVVMLIEALHTFSGGVYMYTMPFLLKTDTYL